MLDEHARKCLGKWWVHVDTGSFAQGQWITLGHRTRARGKNKKESMGATSPAIETYFSYKAKLSGLMGPGPSCPTLT